MRSRACCACHRSTRRRWPGTREVFAQVGAELVVRGGAVPDRVLLGAGQYRDRLGQLAVGGQRPVRVQVGAQHLGQDDRVAVVGFAPGDRVPVAVAGHAELAPAVPRRANQAALRVADGRYWREASSRSMPMTPATWSRSLSQASKVTRCRRATAAIMQSTIPRGVIPD